MAVYLLIAWLELFLNHHNCSHSLCIPIFKSLEYLYITARSGRKMQLMVLRLIYFWDH
jgi:hypothetical protein